MEQKALRRLLDWAHGDPDWVRRDPFGRFTRGGTAARRPSFRGTTSERAKLERVYREAAEAFTMDLPGGYRTGNVKVLDLPGGRGVSVHGLIFHPESAGGAEVGDFGRYIRYDDPTEDGFGFEHPGRRNPDGSPVLEAYHSGARLEAEHQGAGVLSVLNEAAAMWYDSVGVDAVTVVAGDAVGGYAWARHGFGWDPLSDVGGTVPSHLREAAKMLRRTGGQEWGIEDPEVAKALLADIEVVEGDAAKDFPTFTPRDVAMLGYDTVRWTERLNGRDVEMWPGKAILLGSSWSGVDFNYQENAARAAQLILAKTQADPEGFSYDPVTGRQPTEGFMVSLRGLSQRFRFDGDRDGLAQRIYRYIEDHADIFEDRDLYVGGWLDTEHGEFVLDPSQNVRSRTEAIRLGRERNQQAIRDVIAGREIPTGGDGDR